MAAIPLACAAIAVPGGDGLVGFFVRKERKEHGLQRWVEGPVEAGRPLPRRRGHRHHRRLDRGSDRADPRAGPRGRRASLVVVDRLAGGGEAIEEAAGAPYRALVTIDEIYPDRPDRTRSMEPPVEPDAVEIRVVGCLIEKQRTTPDVYPLSLNSLRLACNQSTNRDPVVDYDEATVTEALRRLALRGWTRLASGPGGRARKYRHLLDEALGLDAAEVSLLAVLMLRGPQTPGELKQRCERLHPFADLAAVHETLDGLVGRGIAVRHPRRPGQKEERYEQLLGAPRGSNRRRASLSPATPRSGSSGSSARSRSCANRSRRCAPRLASSGRRRVAVSRNQERLISLTNATFCKRPPMIKIACAGAERQQKRSSRGARHLSRQSHMMPSRLVCGPQPGGSQRVHAFRVWDLEPPTGATGGTQRCKQAIGGLHLR